MKKHKFLYLSDLINEFGCADYDEETFDTIITRDEFLTSGGIRQEKLVDRNKEDINKAILKMNNNEINRFKTIKIFLDEELDNNSIEKYQAVRCTCNECQEREWKLYYFLIEKCTINKFHIIEDDNHIEYYIPFTDDFKQTIHKYKFGWDRGDGVHHYEWNICKKETEYYIKYHPEYLNAKKYIKENTDIKLIINDYFD